MFNLLELDDQLIAQLSQQDLTQCARVNKQWHYAVIPYLWSDITWLGLNEKKWPLFYNIVHADYQQSQEHGQGTGSLSKYCRWIHNLPDIFKLMILFSPKADSVEPENPQPDAQRTTYTLLRYFLVHCTGIKSLKLSEFDSMDDGTWIMVADVVIPRLQKLNLSPSTMKATMCQYVLSRCSAKLEALVLNTKLIVNEDAIEVEADGGEPLTRLRELEICLFDDGQFLGLSSFLGRCQHIERLVLLVYYPSDSHRRLLTAMGHMPKLSELCVFRRPHSATTLPDKSFAALLSACQGNLRIVDATNAAVFGELSCEALLKHSCTLEKLDLERWSSFGSTHLKQILTSCPRLHTLGTLSNGDCDTPFVSSINALDFMDLDHNLNTLKPWPCESTLRVFKAKITNIPRPDATHDVYYGPRLSVAKETYPGEGQVIQRRVYERLARFSNLETLWLGHVAHRVTGIHLHLETEAGYTGLDEEVPLHYDTDNQYDCLEMSLQSGLGQLKSLKQLYHLNTSLMKTTIGSSEVQWMVEYWPKMKKLDGLHMENDDHLNAATWIDKNCPHIQADLTSVYGTW